MVVTFETHDAPEMRGPFPRMTSNSMPSAGSGVRISLKKMTPSVLNARHGCSESSIAISGVSERWRKGYFSEYSRKAAMYRPAWRMSQTGVRSVSATRGGGSGWISEQSCLHCVSLGT